MRRRVLIVVLLLTAAMQGPMLSWVDALQAVNKGAVSDCSEAALIPGQFCDQCCSHGVGRSCATQCPAPVSAAAPLAFPFVLRLAVRGLVIPDPGLASFQDHAPPNHLRPPIV